MRARSARACGDDRERSDFDDFAGLEHALIVSGSRMQGRSSMRHSGRPDCAEANRLDDVVVRFSATSARPTASGPSPSSCATGSS
jgi:hypothetical protein